MSTFSVATQIVIDASALVELLLGGARSTAIRQAIGDAQLLAPDLVHPEVTQTLRSLERGGKLSGQRASTALARLREGAIWSMPTAPLLERVWALRQNLSAYDACYVALARALSCPLLTLDGPLTRAPRLGVTLIVP